MTRLVWAPAALRDLARLHAFLRPDNPDAARRAISAIRQGVRLLGEHPEAGRLVEEMEIEFREWPISFGSAGYLVLYRFDRGEVVLLSVRHGREAGYGPG
jgi:plasmid stabilization system protein ParE